MNNTIEAFSSVKIEAVSTALLALGLLGVSQLIAWYISRNKPIETQRFWRLTLRNAFTVCFVVGLIVLWRAELQSVLLALGAATVGILVTFKESWMSMLAFWIRFLKRPYNVNDFIEIDGVRGRVLDITWLTTVLAETYALDSHVYTGRIVQVPNNRILISAYQVENLTGFYNAHMLSVTLPAALSAAEALARKKILETVAIVHCEPFFSRAEKHMHALQHSQAMDTPQIKPRVSLHYKAAGEIALNVRIVVPFKARGEVEQAIIADYLAEVAKSVADGNV